MVDGNCRRIARSKAFAGVAFMVTGVVGVDVLMLCLLSTVLEGDSTACLVGVDRAICVLDTDDWVENWA